MPKILVVDDDPPTLKGIEMVLKNAGYTTKVSLDGHETVTLVKSFAPDLLLLDAMLIGIDGRHIAQQLKSHDYGSVYDGLPNSSRSRMSRDRFVSALERAQGIYELDRMDVGIVKIAGNLAVVDTTLYGRVTLPVQAEGKIVVQQYLIKEEGKWRVATGDQSTIKKFLAANPSFSKGFRIKQPQIYVKQDGKWVEFSPQRPPRRQT